MDPRRFRSRISWAIVALSTAGYAVWLYAQPPQFEGRIGIAVISTLVVAFLINFPVLFTRGDSHLTHFVGLLLTLAYPGPFAATVLLAGVIAGNWARRRWALGLGHPETPGAPRLSSTAFDWAQQCSSILVASAVHQLLSGWSGVPPLQSADLSRVIALIPAFLLTHFGMLLLRSAPTSENVRTYLRGNLLPLLIVEGLPLPFALFAISTSGSLGVATLLALVGLLALLAIVVNSLGRTTRRLEKNLKELTTLTSVSRAMRTSLDMQALLEIIYLQVAHLLGVQNFYVALYNADHEGLTYPIAFRNGLREEWRPRPQARRLTDRVIQSRAPLLISRDVPAALKRMGLDAVSTHSPTAWLGVPLLSAERALGCLAVFSTDPAEILTEDDLNLLTTIAAQASVGIENAQLYSETQRRAAELRTLTELSALMSATLDPERVLELVCSSVIRVVGCERSAIFLRDSQRHELWLARAEGLTSAYMQASLTIPLDDAERAKCVATGQPVIVPDVETAGLPPAMEDLARIEGIRAVADLPLRSQGDIIGFLSVYYSTPHRFRPAEIELLKTFASQAALAVANARLYARTDQALAQRLTQLSALEAIGREVSSTLELDRLFDILLERAMSSTNASSGRVLLADGEERLLTTAAVRGRHTESSSPARRTDGEGQDAGTQAIQTREPVYRSVGRGAPGSGAGSNGREAMSELAVPILNKGQSLGAISLESVLPGAFSREDIQFVTQLAVQASIAIQNGRLFESVREGRDRLAAVLNSTREGVLMIDAGGRVALANPQVEGLLGLPGSRLVGRPLGELMADPAIRIQEKLGFTADQLQALLAELHSGRAATAHRVAYQISEPRRRFLERSGTPVLDGRERVIGWVMVLRDVTEEKELEEIRDSLTGMIVHDLRSPLNAIMGSLSIFDTILRQHPARDLLTQARDVGVRSSQKLLGLVDSLLDISRMESGDIQLSKKPVRIQHVVDDLMQDLSPLAADLQIRLINEIPPDFPPVLVDEEKSGRVFTNLIDNALKFTPSGGRVVVQGSRDGTTGVVFKVLDDGPGIPDDYRERIFDRFVQVRDQVGRRKGSGIGLAFCKLAVEAHGGRIWVENRPEGGAAFVFTIPE